MDKFSFLDSYEGDAPDPFEFLDTYEEPPKPSLAGDIGRLALQGVSNVGGTVGYGLEKTGIAPEFGRKLQESDFANTQRLQANLSPEQQSANVQPFINPNYKPDTPEGSSYINPEFGLRSVIGNVVPSIPGTLAMGVLGSPLASAATKGLRFAGLGAKTAQIAGQAAKPDAAEIIGTGLGFGASEGAFSGAQNAAQWGAEQRAKPIEAFATSPAFQQALAEFGDPEKAKEAIINKGQSDIFNETLIKTGGISALTGGGAFGVLKGAQATDKILPSLGKGVLSEAGQEAPQSFYEEVATNKATQKYVDPTQDPYENALNAGIIGGIAGGVMGSVGGVGPLARAAMNAARTRNERTDQNTSNTGQSVSANDSQPATGNFVGEVGQTNTGNYQQTPTTEPLNERNRSTEADNRSTITGDQPLAGTDGSFGTGQPNFDLLNPNNTRYAEGQPGQINPVDQLRNLDGRNLQEETRNGLFGGQLQERNIQPEPGPTRRNDEVAALINEELARDPKAKPQEVINRVTDEVEFESKKQSALDRWNEAFNSAQDEKAKKVLANDIKLLNAATPDNLDKKVEKASERANKYGVTIPEENYENSIRLQNRGDKTDSVSSIEEVTDEQEYERDSSILERDRASNQIIVNDNRSTDGRMDERRSSINELSILSGTRPPLADNLTESKANDFYGKPDSLLASSSRPRDVQVSNNAGSAQESTDEISSRDRFLPEHRPFERNSINRIESELLAERQDLADNLTESKANEDTRPNLERSATGLPEGARGTDGTGTGVEGTPRDRTDLLTTETTGLNNEKASQEESPQDAANADEKGRESLLTPTHRLNDGYGTLVKQEEDGSFSTLDGQDNYSPDEEVEPLTEPELKAYEQEKTKAQDQRTEGRAEIPVGTDTGRYDATQDRGTSALPDRLPERDQSADESDVSGAGGELSQLIPEEAKPLVENARKNNLTKDQFLSAFEQGLNDQNLSRRETVQKTDAYIRKTLKTTPEEFYDRYVIQTEGKTLVEKQDEQVQIPEDRAPDAAQEDLVSSKAPTPYLEAQISDDEVQDAREKLRPLADRLLEIDSYKSINKGRDKTELSVKAAHDFFDTKNINELKENLAKYGFADKAALKQVRDYFSEKTNEPTPTNNQTKSPQPTPQEQDTLATGTVAPSEAQAEPVREAILAKSGKPFSTPKVAQAALKSSSYPQTEATHEVVPVNGGYGLQAKKAKEDFDTYWYNKYIKDKPKTVLKELAKSSDSFGYPEDIVKSISDPFINSDGKYEIRINKTTPAGNDIASISEFNTEEEAKQYSSIVSEQAKEIRNSKNATQTPTPDNAPQPPAPNQDIPAAGAVTPSAPEKAVDAGTVAYALKTGRNTFSPKEADSLIKNKGLTDYQKTEPDKNGKVQLVSKPFAQIPEKTGITESVQQDTVAKQAALKQDQSIDSIVKAQVSPIYSKPATYKGNKSVTVRQQHEEDIGSELSIEKPKGKDYYQIKTPNGTVLSGELKDLKSSKQIAGKILESVKVINGRPFAITKSGNPILLKKAYGSMTGGTSQEIEKEAKKYLSSDQSIAQKEIHQFSDYDKVAKEYGYQVKSDGSIAKEDGKELPVKVSVVKNRLRIEAKDSGNLLYSGSAEPKNIGKFVEKFWYAQKKPQTATIAAQDTPIEQASQTETTQTAEASAAQTGTVNGPEQLQNIQSITSGSQENSQIQSGKVSTQESNTPELQKQADAIAQNTDNKRPPEQILTQPKTDYIKAQKKAWLSEHKNALPHIKEKAFKDIETNYETEVERAHASLPFEQYKALPENKGQSENVLRQVHGQLQSEYGAGRLTDKVSKTQAVESKETNWTENQVSELGVPISGTQLNTQATENKGLGVVSESGLNKDNQRYLERFYDADRNQGVRQHGGEFGAELARVDAAELTRITGKNFSIKQEGYHNWKGEKKPLYRAVLDTSENETKLTKANALDFTQSDKGLHFVTGQKAFLEGEKRELPSYYLKSNNKNAKDWFKGYDHEKSIAQNPPESIQVSNDASKKGGKIDTTKFSKADKPQLYSQLRKAFDSTPDRIFSTGPQVKAWLKGNAPKLGVKADEIYWSGIEDYLDIQGKVSKQDVLSYLNENGVKTEDVVLDDKKLDIAWTDQDAEEYSRLDSRDERGFDLTEEERQRFYELGTRFGQAMSTSDREYKRATKHNKPTLTLPGGKDYRETVVTIPTVEKFNERDSTHFGDVASGKQIAWTRSNVRTDASGKDSLFLEEIQSQRGQEGRKKGFSNPIHIGDTNIQYNDGIWEVIDSNGNLLSRHGTENDAARQRQLLDKGVPPAPFVTDSNNKATNAYISLLLKKSVLQAIENGQDSVSWTTGTQQADRYDLSRQISRVSYDQLNNLKAYDLNNRLVMHEQIPEEQIQDHIGKEPAEKLLKTPTKEGVREIAGMDLKLGGEWADSMYGNEQGLDRNGKPSLVLQAGRDIAKRFGGTVGIVDLNTGKQPALIITPEMRAKVTGEGLPLFSKEKAKTGSTVAELKGLLNAQDKELVQSGKLKVVQSKTDIPKGLISIDANGVEGFYDPKSKSVYLIADNVTKDNLRSVLDHEYLHAALAENPKLKDRLMGAHSELRDIFSKVESGEYTGKYKSLYDESLRRTDRAKTPDADRFEEWLAYQITQWQKSPSSLPQRLAKAIKDLVAAIKAAIYKYTGYIGQISPADLVALARASMNVSENSSSSSAIKQSSQQSGIDFANEVLNELSNVDELFRFPVSNKTTLDGVMKDIAPDFKFVGDDTRSDEQSESGADNRYLFKTEKGKPFYVYERGDEIWIDVSRLSTGERGAAIYSAIGNYAYNTNKVFIGDPEGLSNDAVIRRTANMLSLALRFGTTDFMEPSIEQKKGISELGVIPLEWKGNDVDKTQALIQTFVSNLQNQFPEINQIKYDFDKRQFIRRDNGRPVDWAKFNKYRAEYGVGRAARAGEATTRRGAFIQSLISSESGERPGILEQVLSRSNQLVKQGGLSGMFSKTKYSVADDLREFKERAGLGPKHTLTQTISDILSRGVSGNTQLIKDKWEEVKPQIEQGVFDKFLGIKLAEKEILGDVAHSLSGYIGARLSTGSSSTMSAIIQYGAPEWKGGIIQKKAGSKGFADIIKPVADDMENFTAWMVARRSDRLFMEGKENNFTREMIDAGLSLFKPKYQTVADDIAALNSSILDLAQDAGLIESSARALFENTDYIPFYRIVEGKAKGPRSRQGLSHQTSGIRMLKGGENPMSDPLGNLMQNWAHLVDASMKNSALDKTLKNLEGSRFITSVPRVEFKSALIPKEQIKKLMLDSGLPQQIVDAMPPEITKGIAKMWAMQAPTDPDIVRVMRGGKSDYFRVNDGMLLTSLVAVNQTPLTGAFKYMRAFKSLLTGAVTADPTFMARNFIRDSMQSWTIAEEKGFKFGVDSIKGAIKTFKEDNDFIDMMFAGASFQGGYGNYNNPDAARKSMDAALRKKGIKDVNGFMESVLDTPKKYWEAYRSIGDAIENANRDAILENAKKAGKEKAEYLFEAKDIMDFSMHGSFVLFRALNDMLPFFNARLEGLYRLVRAGKTQEAKKLILMKGASIAMMSLALLALNSDNDDYEALESWDADAYWHFFFGNQHFRIPKPFELGLVFGTIPERSARLLIGKDTLKEFSSRMGHAASDTLAFNPIPQMFRPFMEVYANTDMFTGRPIENMADEGKLPSARYNQSTSETMRLLSSLLPEALGASPKRLEHLMHGYTGAMGMYLLGTSDILVNAASGGPSEPSMRMDRIPVLKAFYQQTPAMHTKYGTQFYDMLREVEQVNRTINAYKKEGRLEEAKELQQENADKLKVRKQLTKANKSLSEVRKTIDAIHRSNLSPDQKRVKIDRLMEQSNEKIQALVKRTHPYFN